MKIWERCQNDGSIRHSYFVHHFKQPKFGIHPCGRYGIQCHKLRDSGGVLPTCALGNRKTDLGKGYGTSSSLWTSPFWQQSGKLEQCWLRQTVRTFVEIQDSWQRESSIPLKQKKMSLETMENIRKTLPVPPPVQGSTVWCWTSWQPPTSQEKQEW